MSKKIRWLIISLIVGVLAGVIFFYTRPKPQDSFVEKEISIKQAEVVDNTPRLYEDTSGFSFEYPGDLKIQEVELDNPLVYSSLELAGPVSGRLVLRISDTTFKSLADWQKDFEKNNVLSGFGPNRWADLTGIEFNYGAPKLKRVVAYEAGVLYVLEAPADDGYWENVLGVVLSSFEFKSTVYQTTPAATSTSSSDTDSNIILLEETVE